MLFFLTLSCALLMTAVGAQKQKHRTPSISYCVPWNDCFPSNDALQEFNATVNGRLIKTVPYGKVCYKGSYDAEACKTLVTKQGDGKFRLTLPAGLMYTNWEQDGGHGCPIPPLPADGSAPSPVQGNCTLGGMSAYVVNASSADDIARTVQFAAKYSLRLRIKNTGHDYTGRSSGPGTFAIWTHYMNDLTMINNFRAKNFHTTCAYANPRRVVSAGPGVTIEEMFAFGAKNNVVTVGGFCPTVGVAGGYLLGGGTGPLGPVLGMAVDNVVQFEVVTADGQKKTINECSDPDLFWALRGGGGAFAVVTRAYYKAHDEPKAVDTFTAQIGCANRSAYTELISRMVDIQVPIREHGEMGIWAASGKQLGVQILSLAPLWSTASRAKTSAELFNPVLTVPGCLAKHDANTSKQFNDAYQSVLLPVIKAETPLGSNVIDQSRIISYDVMNDSAKRAKVKDFIVSLPKELQFLWQNAVGDASRRVASTATSVHPDWRNAFAFMDIPVFGPPTGDAGAQDELAQAVLKNATTVLGTSAYYNEASEFEDVWQDSFFGANYKRLMQIKTKVDPRRVLNCRLCVGSEVGS